MEVKIQNDQPEKIEKVPIEQIENNVVNLSTTSILLNLLNNNRFFND